MIFSYFNLVVYTLYLVYILWKIKCRLFLGLGTILILYEVFFTSKAVINTLFYLNLKVNNNIIEQNNTEKNIFKLVSSLANRLKWFILYFLLISVREIVIMMKAQTFESFHKDKKRWARMKKIIFTIYFLMASSIIGLNIIDVAYKEDD